MIYGGSVTLVRLVVREIPSNTVLFLSNLPKSVVAFPFYSLEHVVEQIEAIYDDKFASDKADEADGVAREELVRLPRNLRVMCIVLTPAIFRPLASIRL
jgi:hypothetical protein